MGELHTQPDKIELRHTPTPWRFDGDWYRLPTIYGAEPANATRSILSISAAYSAAFVGALIPRPPI